MIKQASSLDYIVLDPYHIFNIDFNQYTYTTLISFLFFKTQPFMFGSKNLFVSNNLGKVENIFECFVYINNLCTTRNDF